MTYKPFRSKKTMSLVTFSIKKLIKKKVTEMTQTAKNQDKIQPDTSEGKEGGRLPVMLSHYEM